MNRKLTGKIGYTMLAICVLIMSVIFFEAMYANYEFNNKYMSYWNLADKSSTIEAKSEYIDKLVTKLETNKHDFTTNNAVFFITPDNSLEYNIDALKTLNERLNIIKDIAETDFAYQSAIQQITEQEQGQAHDMLNVIEGCWYLNNYPYLWSWIGFILFVIISLLTGFSILLILKYHFAYDEDD